MKKESVYYYNKPTVYRPNRQELHNRMFNCPKCKSMMSRPRHKILNIVYSCPSCGFTISETKILADDDSIQREKEMKNNVVNNVLRESSWVKKINK